MKFKNYIVLYIFYIFTILGVLYLCKIYSNSRAVSNLLISDYTIDITDNSYEKILNNILNFSSEHNEFVIYISSYKDVDMTSFEESFIDVINRSNLKNKILFINSDSLSSFEFINNFICDMGGNISVFRKDLPIFIIVSNRRVLSVKSVSGFDESSLNDILGGIYD